MRYFNQVFHHPARGLIPAIAVLGLLAFGRPAQATDNLRAELVEAAKNIRSLLKDEGAIAVGDFTGPRRTLSSAGPVIEKMLKEELKKMSFEIKNRASYEVKGDYVDIEDKPTKRLGLKLKFRVLDRNAAALSEFERAVLGTGTIATILGLTADIPAKGDDKVRDDKLREAIDNPKSTFSKTTIKASNNSPYAIEILVRPKSGKNYVARNPKDEDGLSFVNIQRDEIYAIKLINNSEHEAAVTTTIDGLNIFSFSDLKDDKGKPKYSVLILNPKSSFTLKGWHRTNDYSEEFYVTEYSKSAAAELKSTTGIGTVTCLFSACWPKNGKPPSDEPNNPSEFSRSGDATGRGQQYQQKYVEVERNFGVVRATISVRYTKANAPADLPPK